MSVVVDGSAYDLSAQSFITYTKENDIQDVFTLNQDINLDSLPINSNSGESLGNKNNIRFKLTKKQVFDANNKNVQLPPNIDSQNSPIFLIVEEGE